MPTVGSAVDTSSYTVCQQHSGAVIAGEQITFNCDSSSQQFRYVIVRSSDATPEHLCIGEVAVYVKGQYVQSRSYWSISRAAYATYCASVVCTMAFCLPVCLSVRPFFNHKPLFYPSTKYIITETVHVIVQTAVRLFLALANISVLGPVFGRENLVLVRLLVMKVVVKDWQQWVSEWVSSFLTAHQHMT